MRAVILAAGRGSRLKKFSEEQPKCLNEVNGRSLLRWQLSALKKGGVNEVIIVGGYKSDMLRSFETKIVLNERWESTNMVSSFLCTSEYFNERIIVSYSDILYGPEVVLRLCCQSGDAVVVYDTAWRKLWEARFDDPLKDAESFRIDKNGLIQDIGQRVASLKSIEGQYIGLMLFTPKALSWIIELTSKRTHNVDKMDMTTLLRLLVEEGRPIKGMPIQEGWCEIDTPKDLELAKTICSKGLLNLEAGNGT